LLRSAASPERPYAAAASSSKPRANWWAMHAERQADLYEGRAEEALRAIEAEWPRLSGSMLLMVQATKLESLHLRARAALMLAAMGKGDKKALLRAAARDAGSMEQERSRWAAPLAVLVRAGIAATEGDPSRALGMLAFAAEGCEAADMALFAAAARYRRGQLLGGEEGRALRDPADAWMAKEGVFNRERMVGMLAPGFSG
jgi:eukaryotic-like serine/threonine-protein kinase